MTTDHHDETLEPPSGLGQRGAALWRDVHDRFDLLPWEEVVLIEACRAFDTLDRLAKTDAPDFQTNKHGETVAAAHVVEARMTQAAAIRLLATLRLPTEVDEFGEITGGGRPQRRGAARGAYGARNLRSVN